MTPHVLLNLSNLPWVPGRLKRNQAIFRHLLAGTDLFSEGVFINPPTVAEAPRKYLPDTTIRLVAQEEIAGRPVTVIEPVYGLPDWHVSALTARWARKVADDITLTLQGVPYWLWMNSAGKLQHGLGLHLAPGAERRVFDSSDDFTAWEGPDYRLRLHELVALSDKLLCVNQHVAGLFDHPDKLVFHNCTDFEMFRKGDSAFRLEPWIPKPEGAVYIGFTGGINSTRADVDLLETLFRRFPDWRFLFVGYSDDPGFLSRLLQYPNVTFIPERPYQELPSIIRSFNVAIIPHADNPTTRGNDLLKVLDYMACGVPVVSTHCSNVDQYLDAIRIAETTHEFSDMIEGLVTGVLCHDPEPGFRAAAARSWKAEVPGLMPWLTGTAAMVTTDA